MLDGWWPPKTSQDNGSNTSTGPLNYCCVRLSQGLPTRQLPHRKNREREREREPGQSSEALLIYGDVPEKEGAKE